MSKSTSNPVRLVAHMLAAVFNSRAVFHREWARYQIQTAPADSVAGRWIGEWVSDRNGHHGQLRCVLSPVSANLYRACFYATFSLLFRVGYVTELRAERSDSRTFLKGESDLGPLAGGVYRCEGEVKGTEFTCRYSCKYDEGIFHLKRFD